MLEQEIKSRNPYKEITAHTGDFAHRDFTTLLTIISHNADQYFQHTLQNPSVHLLEEQSRLVEKIDEARCWVQDDTHYPSNAAYSIWSRYAKADQTVRGKSIEARAHARLAEFTSIQIATDLDGTITLDPTSYLHYIPASVIAEPALASHPQQRNGFPDIFVRIWQPYLRETPELFRSAGNYAPIRPGVDCFLAYAHQTNIETYVVSANFEPFVFGVLDRIQESDHITHVYAVQSDNINVIDKGTILKHLAKSNPEKALIYIGDGASDKPAMDKEARNYVAAYFALEGSEFAHALQEADLTYFTYKNFDDITQKLQQLQIC